MVNLDWLRPSRSAPALGSIEAGLRITYLEWELNACLNIGATARPMAGTVSQLVAQWIRMPNKGPYVLALQQVMDAQASVRRAQAQVTKLRRDTLSMVSRNLLSDPRKIKAYEQLEKALRRSIDLRRVLMVELKNFEAEQNVTDDSALGVMSGSALSRSYTARLFREARDKVLEDSIEFDRWRQALRDLGREPSRRGIDVGSSDEEAVAARRRYLARAPADAREAGGNASGVAKVPAADAPLAAPSDVAAPDQDDGPVVVIPEQRAPKSSSPIDRLDGLKRSGNAVETPAGEDAEKEQQEPRPQEQESGSTSPPPSPEGKPRRKINPSKGFFRRFVTGAKTPEFVSEKAPVAPAPEVLVADADTALLQRAGVDKPGALPKAKGLSLSGEQPANEKQSRAAQKEGIAGEGAAEGADLPVAPEAKESQQPGSTPPAVKGRPDGRPGREVGADTPRAPGNDGTSNSSDKSERKRKDRPADKTGRPSKKARPSGSDDKNGRSPRRQPPVDDGEGLRDYTEVEKEYAEVEARRQRAGASPPAVSGDTKEAERRLRDGPESLRRYFTRAYKDGRDGDPVISPQDIRKAFCKLVLERSKDHDWDTEPSFRVFINRPADQPVEAQPQDGKFSSEVAPTPSPTIKPPADVKRAAAEFSSDTDAALNGHWIYRESLGSGTFGHAGLWVRYDSNLNIVNRVVAKETWLTEEQWTKSRRWFVKLDSGQRIPREVHIHRMLSALERSSSIVRFRDWKPYEERGMYRILMEYCSQGDLSWLITQHSKFEGHLDKDGKPISAFIPARAIWAFFETLAAAAVLMEHGSLFPLPSDGGTSWGRDGQVIHRDIKPSNIFLSAPSSESWRGVPVAKLGDFGLAVPFKDPKLQNPEHLIGTGTKGYMAPEQMKHKDESQSSRYRLSSSTNIYAIGKTILVLMDLQSGDALTDHGYFNVPIPQTVRDHYHSALVDLVEQCLVAEPTGRIQAEELLKEIRKIVAMSVDGGQTAPLKFQDEVDGPRVLYKPDIYQLFAR